MNLYERPLTQKVNVGDEPIRNTVLGLDANWQTKSQWLTDMVDKLPFYATKAGEQCKCECGRSLPHSRAQPAPSAMQVPVTSMTSKAA